MECFSENHNDIDFCLAKPNHYKKEESLSNADFRRTWGNNSKTGEDDEDEFLSFSEKLFHCGDEPRLDSDAQSQRSFGVPLRTINALSSVEIEYTVEKVIDRKFCF